jgi:CheY-like chemotaxis protein
MPRPTILVAEPESAQSLSVRKLVLETAKFNVLTAHSTSEALDLVKMFPNLSAAVLVLDGPIQCEQIATAIKSIKNEESQPIIALAASMNRCKQADYHLSSHEPERLVDLMRELLGDPRAVDQQQQKTG